MARLSYRTGLGSILTLGALTLGTLAGCSWGSNEPPAVLSLGARNLRCQRSEVETALHRESSKVREYYVGCDFMYTRVLCSDEGCHPAKPQPPCYGGGCFKEDPLTFEWELDESLAQRDPQPDASALFTAP
jgi:hypothetical protein